MKFTVCFAPILFAKVKTFLLSVYCTDVLNTHGFQDSDADQTDRSAALYNNTTVEAKDTGGFCSLNGMYQYGTRLDQDTGIQIQITYIKEGGTKAAASDQDIISEPAVQMNIVIWKKTVYISSAYIFLVQVEHGDLRIILEDHAGNDLVTYLNRFSGGINFYVLPIFTISPVPSCPQSYRDQTERISLKLMSIGTTNAASFYLYKDIIVANFRHWEFFDIKMLQGCEDCYMSSLRNIACCCCRRICFYSRCNVCGSGTFHLSQNLFYDFFNIHFHVYHSLSDAKRITHDTSSCLCKALCRGKTLSGTAADGEGGISFSAEAQCRIGRCILYKNSGVDGFSKSGQIVDVG